MIQIRKTSGEVFEEEELEWEYDEEDEDNEYVTDTLSTWFKSDDPEDYEPYIIRMIRAEIESTYPRMSDYDGEDGEKYKDKQDNKKDTEMDYVAQGVVEIQRTFMNSDGSVGDTITLDYIPMDELDEMIAAGDPNVVYYYSFDEETYPEDFLIYYATPYTVETWINGSLVSSVTSYVKQKASLASIITMCSMPYNFLFALLQSTSNPEYIMAVIDLLMDRTEAIFMIQEQLNITEDIEWTAQAEKTETTTTTTTTTNVVNADGSTSQQTSQSTSTSSTGPYLINETETMIRTLEYTGFTYIKEAKTWCMNVEQEIEEVVTENIGEKVDSGWSYNDLSWHQAGTTSSGNSTTVIYQTDEFTTATQQNTKNYTWVIVSTTKEIDTTRFLGLWKNKTGTYVEDSDDETINDYDPEGIEVEYELPPDYKETECAVAALYADGDGENIDLLIELLDHYDNTELHEEILKYYWNYYFGEEVYDVDLDELLNMFSLSTISAGSTSVVTADSVAATIWYTLKAAGYSDYAVAGVLGNLKYESGGLNTAAVENGSGAGIRISSMDWFKKNSIRSLCCCKRCRVD